MSVGHVFTIVSLTLEDLLRRRAIVALAGAVVLQLLATILFSVVLSRMYSEEIRQVLTVWGISMAGGALWQFGRILFAVLAFTSLWSEIRRGTLVTLLVKSATRSEVFVGKFLALAGLAVLYSLIVTGLICTMSISLQGSMDSLLVRAGLDGFFGILTTLAVVCALMARLSIVTGVAVWLGLVVLGSVARVVHVLSVPVAGEISGWLLLLFPASGLFDSLQSYAVQQPISEQGLWEILFPYLHALDYSLVLLLLGTWLFNRRHIALR